MTLQVRKLLVALGVRLGMEAFDIAFWTYLLVVQQAADRFPAQQSAALLFQGCLELAQALACPVLGLPRTPSVGCRLGPDPQPPVVSALWLGLFFGVGASPSG